MGVLRKGRRLRSPRITSRCTWLRLLLYESQQQHARDIGCSSDQERRRETVILHDIADDQCPDRSRDAADEVVNRERRVCKIVAGVITDHGLGKGTSRFYDTAVKNQFQITKRTKGRRTAKPYGHLGR